ncbi:MAG: GIN domain-containing protein [Acidimicrobiales bacterium]
MFITRQHLTLLGIGGLAIFGASACNLSVDLGTDGSGTAQTTTYDFDNFTEVDIADAFEATIIVTDGPPTVEITLDDNLFDQLEVSVDNDELKIEMDGINIDFNVDPTIKITMPQLTELDISGAVDATVDNAGGDLKVDISGASNLKIDGRLDSLALDGSGASSIEYEGVADEVNLDISGASTISFDNADVGTANVDLSGSSDATFDKLDQLSGEISGASSVDVPEETDVSVATSGAASVDRN